jgi:Caspase domain
MSNNHQYAFIIGVGRRPDDEPALAITAADATCIYEKLTGACAFVKDNVHLITEGDASRTKIIDQVDILISQTQQRKAELVLIFFSGHGYTKDNKYYLIAYDTDKNDIEHTAIDGSLFINKINQINTAKLVLLLDCCHAGGFADQHKTLVPFSTEDFLHNTNRVIITSSEKWEKSFTAKPVSVFTYALIEGLHGKDLREDESRINVFDLALYVRERTRALTKNIQNPGFDVLPQSFTENFAIVDYQNKKPGGLAFEEAFQLYKDGKEVVVTDDFSAGADRQFRELWCDKLNIKEADIGFVRVEEMHVKKSVIENAHFKNPTFDAFQTKDEEKDKIIRNQFFPVKIRIEKDRVIYGWKKNIAGKITEVVTEVEYSDADLHLNVSDFFIRWAKAVQQYDDSAENNFQILGKLLARFIDLENQLKKNFNVSKILVVEPEKNIKIRVMLDITNDAGVLCNLPWEYLFVTEKEDKEWITGKKTDAKKKYKSFFLSADNGLQFQFVRQTKEISLQQTEENQFTILVVNNTKLTESEWKDRMSKMEDIQNARVHLVDKEFKDSAEFCMNFFAYVNAMIDKEVILKNYVLHYAGESKIDDKEWMLSFTTENAETEYMSANKFAGIFEDSDTEKYFSSTRGTKILPKLIFLDVDESAKIYGNNNSIALKLSYNDIPAVLGFQDKFPAEARNEFISQFYHCISKGMDVAQAATFARQYLKSPEWQVEQAKKIYLFGIPVLFISTEVPVKLITTSHFKYEKGGETKPEKVPHTKYCLDCGNTRLLPGDWGYCDIKEHRKKLVNYTPGAISDTLSSAKESGKERTMSTSNLGSDSLSAKRNNE